MLNLIVKLFIVILLSCALPAYAQQDDNVVNSTSQNLNDSILSQPRAPFAAYNPTASMPLSSGERFFRNKYVQMTYIGVPLVVAGIATRGYASEKFNHLSQSFAPDFNYTYDEYLRFAPAAAMLAMKACGVKGRSSWGRMLGSDAFSVALMAGTVYGVKHTITTERPDGSDFNSFPSGHSATAFMAAHMLHKEYGNVSPWISVGGYAVATATGATRMLNNKHWMSDILAGAGIGILAVEFGYLFADLIFKENGLENFIEPDFSIPQRPSNVGLTMGLSLPLASLQIGDGQKLLPSTGSRMGIDGTWFITPNVGIGGAASATSVPMSLSSDSDQQLSFDATTIAVGAYESFQLGENSRFRFNLKTLVGCNIINNRNLLPDVIKTDAAGFYYEVGASFSVALRRHFGASIFCDYGGNTFSTTHTPSSEFNLTRDGRHFNLLHTATIGISTTLII